MKIIMSHDVDHLFGTDHIFDLIYPKLWIRSTIEVFFRKISLKEWFFRMISPFQKRRHRIYELSAFDNEFNVKSTFFFGMAKGLGMNYNYGKTKNLIEYLTHKGFCTGVHGIEFKSLEGIHKEMQKFEALNNFKPRGIRMHYVRFNENTFHFLEEAGYEYDSTEFNKTEGFLLKKPYKINSMWEFPLSIMDGYLPNNLKEKKIKTIQIIEEAESMNLPYITILFHDIMYCPAYQTEKEWYEWLIKWLKNKKYEFISFEEAIKEMEE